MGLVPPDQIALSLGWPRCARRGSSGLRAPTAWNVPDHITKAGLPTMYLYQAHVRAGGLIFYGPDLPDMFRRCGAYVGRLLGGTKPAQWRVALSVRMLLSIKGPS
jgi:hypothetical protein